MDSLFYQPAVEGGVLNLTPEESRHCIKVLRKRKGDRIDITDGRGHLYAARIVNSDSDKCTFEIESARFIPTSRYSIHIAVSPTKNADRMEWMTEKCVELGINELTFIHCQRTERKVLNTERIERVALSAMKQSQRVWLPVINGLKPFREFAEVDRPGFSKYIAHVDSSNPELLYQLAKSNGHYLVLIGPEGDFSTDELEAATRAGFKSVSLGSARLRTETAGVAACHILNLINNEAT